MITHPLTQMQAAPSSSDREKGRNTPLASPIRSMARAFTVVELLMVMAIMLVVMGFVIVAFPTIGKAGNLTSGAQSFVDLLNQARQSALGLNRFVEVRFYYLPGPTDGTTATAYRAMRIIVCDVSGNTSTTNGTTTTYATGANPGNVQRLPTGVIIYSNSNAGSGGTYFTTLLPAMTGASSSTAPTPTWPAAISTSLKAAYGTEYLPGNGTVVPVAYAAIQFKPTGGTNLDPLGTAGVSGSTSDKWFISFVSQTDPAPAGNNKPANNFVTVVVDPFTGRVRVYRPS